MSQQRSLGVECVNTGLTVGQGEGLHVELVARPQARFGEELIHGHHQVSLRRATHPVQDLLDKQKRNKR